MKRKRFTEEQIIGILKESDWWDIQVLERYGGLQAVPQRIASIIVEMRPNLILDAQETITGTRIANVFAPTWSIIDGFAVWRLTRFSKGFLRLVVDVPCRSGSAHQTMGSMCTENAFRRARWSLPTSLRP